MTNFTKLLIACAFFVTTFPISTYAQNMSLFNPTNAQKVLRFGGNGLQFDYISNNHFRHNTLSYLPMKIDGLNVVSVNQPGTGYDKVYYIDNNGTTHYKSMSSTGPMNNYAQFGQTHYDSFNPHGSEDFYQGVLNGLASLFFTKRFSKKR